MAIMRSFNTRAAGKDEEACAGMLSALRLASAGLEGADFGRLFNWVGALAHFRAGEAREELMGLLKDKVQAEGAGAEDVAAAVRSAMPFLRRGADPVIFLAKVADVALDAAAVQATAASAEDAARLVPALQLFGDLISLPSFSDTLAAEYLTRVYAALKASLPTAGAEASAFDFSVAEALLFAFHAVGSRVPTLVTDLCGLRKERKQTVFTGQPGDILTPSDVNPEERAALQASVGVVRATAKAQLEAVSARVQAVRDARKARSKEEVVSEETKAEEAAVLKRAGAEKRVLASADRLCGGLLGPYAALQRPPAVTGSWQPKPAAPKQAGGGGGKGKGGDKGGDKGGVKLGKRKSTEGGKQQ
jgi:hypothetical protein